MTYRVEDSFGQEHELQRGLRMERVWSEDGEIELERRAYVAVRFVPVYDAVGIFAQSMFPQDLSKWCVGIRAEAVP